MKLLYIFKFVCLLFSVRGEEFNLIGDAGQAYSLEVHIGHPKQMLHLIVDTGSTTLAVASYPRRDHDEYFHADNSSSLIDSGKEVQAKYSQGNWVGKYVSDYIKIPSIKELPELRSDFAIITKSHKFFTNGSGWQGLLGLAYLPVGAWGDHVIVGSWLDSVDCHMKKPVSFQLKLCGVQSHANATHYGKFSMIISDDSKDNSTMFRTPILHKRWYEVGVLAVSITYQNQTHLTNDSKIDLSVLDTDDSITDMCETLNEQKSIVDSGTTNIRLPDEIYRKVVDQLRQESQTTSILILDEFWYHGEAACWPEPQDFLTLPWLTIDLLSDVSEDQYFTLEIPPQNYMRVVTARNNSGEGGAVSQFCYKLGLEAGGADTVLGYTAMEGLEQIRHGITYKLGLEAGGADTVLGYTAMEGLEVIFNRSGGWIGWRASSCGRARVSGPRAVQYSLIDACQLTASEAEAASLQAGQWALCGVSLVAAAVLVYLLAPAARTFLARRRHERARDALVNHELS